jgi:hypothetical protein
LSIRNLEIDAAFVFPTPAWAWSSLSDDKEATLSTGMFYLAEAFQVGRLVATKRGFSLNLGPNPIWESGRGWTKFANDRFKSKAFVTGSDVRL